MKLIDHPELRRNLTVIQHGGVELVPRGQLRKAARMIDLLNIKVLGIDAFILYPNKAIQPSLSNDFPDPDSSSCLEYVDRHIGDTDDAITHFEVIIDGKAEPASDGNAEKPPGDEREP